MGFSLGGLIAARFAIEQKHRLRRLVLVAPAGLRVAGVAVDDLFRIPPEELMGRLVHRMETLLPHLPSDPHDVDFAVDRYRETGPRPSCCGSTRSTGCCPAGWVASTSPR